MSEQDKPDPAYAVPYEYAKQGYAIGGPPFGQDMPVEQVAEIIQAEARLADVVGSLDLVVNELEQRIGRVLRPAIVEPSQPEESRLYVPQQTAPLTDFLNAQASRVEGEVARLHDLLHRLAL